MIKLVAVLSLALSSLAVTGCNSGPSCEDAVGNIMKITVDAMPKDDKGIANGLANLGAGLATGKMVDKCKNDKWSEQARKCAVAAKSAADLAKCEGVALGM